MKLVIKAGDNALETILAAGQYQKLWQEHGQSIIKTFYDLTGLEFQQRHITAWTRPGDSGDSGGPGLPMILPAKYDLLEKKADTLTHELAHRLLNGNGINSVYLGLLPDSKQPDERDMLYSHRLIYLFLYDAVKAVFGPAYAEICEKRELNTDHASYPAAWQWAMSLPFEQRQRVLHYLAGKAIPREKWDKLDTFVPPLVPNPEAWFSDLRQK